MLCSNVRSVYARGRGPTNPFVYGCWMKKYVRKIRLILEFHWLSITPYVFWLVYLHSDQELRLSWWCQLFVTGNGRGQTLSQKAAALLAVICGRAGFRMVRFTARASGDVFQYKLLLKFVGIKRVNRRVCIGINMFVGMLVLFVLMFTLFLFGVAFLV